jgi:integrase/recombinase XerD
LPDSWDLLLIFFVKKKEQILSFLDTRIKDTEIDPEKRCIRTWNDLPAKNKVFFQMALQ